VAPRRILSFRGSKKKETYILVTQLKKESLAKVRLGKAAGELNSFKR